METIMSRLRKRVYKKYDVEDKTKLEGLKFGKLTVLERVDDNKDVEGYTNLRWLCECECGVKKVIRGYDLIHGISGSCGCGKIPDRKDISGETFGTLCVQKYVSGKGWLCRCECGREVYRSSCYLREHSNLTCGDRNVHKRKASKLHLDYTGITYGEWTVLHRDLSYTGSKVRYIVENKEGVQKSVFSTYIQQYLKSKEDRINIEKENLVGRRFGKLRVLSLVQFKDGDEKIRVKLKYGDYQETRYIKQTKSKQWLCQCDCGNRIIVKSISLFNGKTQDCGCSKCLKNKEL